MILRYDQYLIQWLVFVMYVYPRSIVKKWTTSDCSPGTVHTRTYLIPGIFGYGDSGNRLTSKLPYFSQLNNIRTLSIGGCTSLEARVHMMELLIDRDYPKRSEHSKIVLIGHSFGCNTILSYLQRGDNAKHVSKIILLSGAFLGAPCILENIGIKNGKFVRYTSGYLVYIVLWFYSFCVPLYVQLMTFGVFLDNTVESYPPSIKHTAVEDLEKSPYTDITTRGFSIIQKEQIPTLLISSRSSISVSFPVVGTLEVPGIGTNWIILILGFVTGAWPQYVSQDDPDSVRNDGLISVASQRFTGITEYTEYIRVEHMSNEDHLGIVMQEENNTGCHPISKRIYDHIEGS